MPSPVHLGCEVAVRTQHTRRVAVKKWQAEQRVGRVNGWVPEWLKGADCKSAGSRLRWFEPSPTHHLCCRFHSRNREPAGSEGRWPSLNFKRSVRGGRLAITCVGADNKNAGVAQW
jgi:hypothetical protein